MRGMGIELEGAIRKMVVATLKQANAGPRTILAPSNDDVPSGAPREVRQYWLDRRGTRDMPTRGDLSPTDIVHLLPNIFLVDVLPGSSKYRYRLIGTNIAMWSGDDATGREMDDPRCGEGASRFVAMHDEVVQTRAPLLTVGQPALFEGSQMLFDRILLPLANADGDVCMILGAADAVPVETGNARPRLGYFGTRRLAADQN